MSDISVLNNGLRVISIPNPSCKNLVYVQFGTNFGSDVEEEGTWEAAHALEHMVASMTSQRFPHTLERATALDTRGVDTNAETTDEYVVYYLCGTPEHTNWMTDLICDVVKSPKLDENVFEQEMKAAIEELTQVSLDEWYDFDQLVNSTWNIGTPRAIGERERIKSIKSFTLSFLEKVHNEWYKPQNVTVMVTGNILPQQLEEIKKKLSTIPKDSSEKVPEPDVTCEALEDGKVIQYPSGLEQVKITIIFQPLVAANELKEVAALDCISALLSEGFSSRFFNHLRSKMGAIYGVNIESLVDSKKGINSIFRISLKCKMDPG